MIYKFLVLSESTDLTIRETREDLDYPVHCYRRLTYSSIIAMLQVNKAIGEESQTYFFREHPFIVVAAADKLASNAIELAKWNMEAVCYEPKASFSQHVLRCTLTAVVDRKFCFLPSHTTVMINAVYLPYFIRSLLIVLPKFVKDWEASLDLNPTLPPLASQINTIRLRVLAPFKHLVRLQKIHLSNNINSMYKEELRTAILSKLPLWPYIRDEFRDSRIRAKH